MNLALKFACAAAVGLVIFGLFGLSLSMISASSTTQVIGGVIILAALLGWGVGKVITSMTFKRLFPCLLLTLPLLGGCGMIEPGHVGIKVNFYGTDKGVDSYPAAERQHHARRHIGLFYTIAKSIYGR